MKKGAVVVLLVLFGHIVRAQNCPELIEPANNQTNVPVSTSISWTEVPGVNGYIISLGTSPGAGDIIFEQSVGLETSFTPPLGLPEQTDIYVTITLFFINQPPFECPSKKFTTEDVTVVPDCTLLESPINGEQGVSTTTLLRWFYAPGAVGYRLTVGTSAGSGDLIDNLDVGNVLFFDPSEDLPAQSDIYVRIVPYNENGSANDCQEERFRTGGATAPPECTNLIDPVNGEINVALSTIVSWRTIPDALGYIVSIGTSPFNNDVLDEAIFANNFVSVINFEPNRTYFVLIVPFNEAGEAQGCERESFSTILGCGPFLDPDTGVLIDLRPEITFPQELSICEDALPFPARTEDLADGYRWYRITEEEMEVLVGEGPAVELSEPGRYRYEAYNRIDQNGSVIECASSSEFVARLSSAPVITNIIREPGPESFNVEVLLQGQGDYELALNNPDGPYTTQRRFNNLPPGAYMLYVRDRGGCGEARQPFKLAFPPPGFPAYFSPNGDGINDFWQYRPPTSDALELVRIQVYDRYGKLLGSFGPNGPGWDGSYRGTNLPAEGYWYRAVDTRGIEYRGYFSLVR